ncbi:MAG: hypothetical protein MK081_04110 [Flavobacteriales bacterium]|nr:hypothetical protein [Flavobacteriales bacterium]
MQITRSLIAIVVSTLSLCAAAFWNGFPILYSDTGTYISSGFGLETPFDRPITYGVLLRLFSLNGLTIWGAVITQSLLVSGLVIRLVNWLVPSKNAPIYGMVILIILSLFSTVSWYSSQLIADIFTSISFLVVLNLFFGLKEGWKQALFYLLFFVSIATHMGHFSQFLAFLMLVLVALWRNWIPAYPFTKRTMYGRLGMLIVLTGLSVLTMGSALAKSKHAFFMGAMLENGVLEKMLDEECDQGFAICEYRDELPDEAWRFIWDESSPFYAMGDFPGTREEFNEIINLSFSKPKYLLWHVEASLKATGRQLVSFGVADGNGRFEKGSTVWNALNDHLSSEIESMESSRQFDRELLVGEEFGVVEALNSLYTLVVVSSIPLLILIVLQWRKISPSVRRSVVLTLLFLLINAWVNGTFANAIPRLGGKVIWLLPMMTMIGCLALLRTRAERKDLPPPHEAT